MSMLHATGRALREIPSISDTKRLKILAAVYENDPLSERTVRQHALAELRALFACAEGGKVAVVESGMDCDGVQYAGRVHIIDATPRALRELYDHIGSWADGPFAFGIVRPSQAEGIVYQSRDRTLEAYEDGHPHSISMGSL